MRILSLSAALLALCPLVNYAAEPVQPPTPAEWQAVVDKATAFLKTTQARDGSWSVEPQRRGITGIVVTGLLHTGTPATSEPAAKGLQYIETLINPKEKHIAGDSKIGIVNYVTSINVMALAAAQQEDKYKPVIANAADYLRKIQWDDGEKITPEDPRWGGAGYGGGGSRPDLSNTSFFLDALKAAGVAPNDPAFSRAAIFVSRCQNLKSEYNDQPWAGKINDGSFIYTAANGGETRTGTKELLGYGSMTYAGVKSLIYANIDRDDARMKAALGWLKSNYTLDVNPGMPPQISQQGLYYYYNTFGKTQTVLGQDRFVDGKGVSHDWKAELFHAIAKRQRADGSWINANDRWMEGDPNLVTGYALMALSYVRPQKK
ncbi:MAG: terpene cyclase/mutase family protein [Bacteroidales bacterium]|nr:terpene cyclase/mutase family protein [Bacteroidales bacterium]